MAKFLSYLILFSVGILFTFSCGDDDSGDMVDMAPYLAIEAGSLQATVDGTVFNSEMINALVLQNDLIRINASAVTEGISLSLSDSSIGTYAVGGAQDNVLEYSNVSSTGGFNITVFTSNAQDNATGSIEILSFDEENQTVSGTFSATLVSDVDPSISIVIENGLFNQISL